MSSLVPQTPPLILLGAGYLLVLGLLFFLIRGWVQAPPECRGPRFKILRVASITAICLACFALAALFTSYYFAGEFKIAGLPLVLLLLGLSGFPRRARIGKPGGV